MNNIPSSYQDWFREGIFRETLTNKWDIFNKKGKMILLEEVSDNDLLDMYYRSISLYDTTPGYNLKFRAEVRKEIYRRLKSK